MRKLLAFVVVLSFSSAEAGFLGSVANAALQGIATYNGYGNGYGSNMYGTNGYGVNAYGTNAYGTTGVANYGTNAYGTNAYGTTGVTNTTVNSTVIANLLSSMYQQAALIQNTYSTNTNIVSYTSSLGNILTTCQSNPSQVVSQLPTMLQYILGIYNILNQYGAGANIKNLASGFSQLLLASMGIS